MSKGLGPLPATRYALGIPGDGYSEDRCTTWPAWDEDQMRAYALQERAEERELCAKLLDAEHEKRKHLDNHAAVYARMLRDGK
jgi:hypothetical protein